VVEAFLKWLVLVDNRNVTDLVQLMEAFDSMLDQLGELDSALYGIGHAFNDDVVVGRFGLARR